MKQALRTQMRERRNAISPITYAKKSSLIRNKVEDLPEFKEAEDILFYASKGREVDTHQFAKEAMIKGKNIYLPRMDGDQLVVCKVDEWIDLEKNDFNILEPKGDCESVHPSLLDLIIVPGLAFDPRGYRVGYGHGHYDQFLHNTSAVTVGIAFEEQMTEHIEEEYHDVPLSIIVTDQRIIKP